MQFTAAAVLSLFDDWKLSLSDPLSKYLPQYPKENLTRQVVEVTLHLHSQPDVGVPNIADTTYWKDNVWRHAVVIEKIARSHGASARA